MTARSNSTLARLGTALAIAGALVGLGSTASAQAATPSISVPVAVPTAAGGTLTVNGSGWTCIAPITVTLNGTPFAEQIATTEFTGTGSFSAELVLTSDLVPGSYTVVASNSTGGDGGSTGGGCQSSATTTFTVQSDTTTSTTTTTTTTTTVAPSTSVDPSTTVSSTIATTIAPTTVESESATTVTTVAPSTSQALATRLPATGPAQDITPYALVATATGMLLVLVARRRPA